MKSQKRLFSRLILIATAAAVLSCSVFEDRGSCLCQVEIYARGYGDGELNCSMWRGGKVHFREVALSSDSGAVMRSRVEKGVSSVLAVWQPRGCNVGTESVRIPLGSQADSIYVGRTVLDCRGDHASDTLILLKQFATMNVRFLNLEMGRPYRVVLRSDVVGMTLPDVEPLGGDFEFRVPLSDDAFSCRIPRQRTEGMILDLLDEGEDVVRRYELGKLITAAGYDWGRPYMTDVDVRLDVGKGEIHVEVQPWQTEIIEEIRF